MFRAGFAKTCISPPLGAPLAGFAARQGVAQGVHDDVFVRALVLETDEARVALLSADLLALPHRFVEDVRRRIAARTGIEASGILIACTHTHSGPVTISTFVNPDETLDASYMNRLADSIEQTVVAACGSSFPARVGVATGRVQGLGVNRRTPDHKPMDDELAIIRVDDAEGHTRALAVQYSCHPTVLGPDNLLVSGDFPAATIDRIEGALGAGAFAMFLNGTQGNISVGHSSELSAIGVITPGRTFERAAELGSTLGDAALAALASIRTTGQPRIAASTLTIQLPLKKYPPLQETAEALRQAQQRVAGLNGSSDEQLRKAKSDLLYASIDHYYARESARFADGSIPIELQGIRIENAAFFAVPAEVFVETGLRIKKTSRHQAFIVGITNGYIGYLPDRASYAAGGYEVVSARVTEDSEDELVRGVMDLEARLFASA
ncbi:MAG: neutral/alkaline non-lysosomal ceramidase N-terminal domain-containing protein [Bryobacteraceae bacterium]